MARRKSPRIPDEMPDQLLSGADAHTAFDQGGLLDQLKKALAERALNAEMDHHLAGEAGAGNSRNSYGRKSVVTDTGRIGLEVPRDRQGSFDPILIAKYQRRFPGFDEKIVSMYARGMSTREIAGHLLELYGIEVSPDLVSAVTDAVLDEIATWQARPLEPVYPLVFFDALRLKIRDEGLVRNKAVRIALGVRADGTKDVLGLWLEQNEGARFWLRVMNELRNRGVEDVLLAVVDGLKGFPGKRRGVGILRRGLAGLSSMHGGRTMTEVSAVFVGIDAAKLKHAVAIAEPGRNGEVRYFGEVDASPDAVRKLLERLSARHGKLHVCYEAGPTGYGLYRQVIKLGHECTVKRPVMQQSIESAAAG